MSKNALIASSIVVALVLILALLLKDQLFDPSLPRIDDDSITEITDPPLGTFQVITEITDHALRLFQSCAVGG